MDVPADEKYQEILVEPPTYLPAVFGNDALEEAQTQGDSEEEKMRQVQDDSTTASSSQDVPYAYW